MEAMWSCTKYGDLANFIPDDLQDLEEAIVDSFISQFGNHSVKRSYFETAKLNL